MGAKILGNGDDGSDRGSGSGSGSSNTRVLGMRECEQMEKEENKRDEENVTPPREQVMVLLPSRSGTVLMCV